LTIGNESLHEISNDYGVRVAYFAALKISLSKVQCSYIATFINIPGRHQMGESTIRSTIFREIGKGIQVYSVRSFRAADCDTGNYLAVANVWEILAVNRQKLHRLHIEKFNLKILNQAEGKKKYHVEVSNRFAAFKDSDAEMEVTTVQETIRENIKNSAKESLGKLPDQWKEFIIVPIHKKGC
jgi:hypothetical protein